MDNHIMYQQRIQTLHQTRFTGIVTEVVRIKSDLTPWIPKIRKKLSLYINSATVITFGPKQNKSYKVGPNIVSLMFLYIT